MNRIKEVIDAISGQDPIKLRELAGFFGDDATINQDVDEIQLGIITYCFHKIFLKIHLKEKRGSLVERTLVHLLEGEYSTIIEDIEEFDAEHGLFEGNLVGKARIKLGSRLHSRGISIPRSAAIVGVKMSDLMDYVGETKEYSHHHRHEGGMKLEDRLNIARDLFKPPPSDGL